MEFNGLTHKQRVVFQKPYKKLNIYTGGVRAGKTVLTYFDIPLLISMFKGKRGVIIGKTLASLSENILNPMRDLYGTECVSEMKVGADAIRYVIIFGEKVRCVGANDSKSENKIRGATYGWAVGDEVSTWSQSMFDMLMSRLSEPNAICIVTTNPDEPSHWFNQNYILKDGIDKAVYNFTIDDNSYLSREYVENLKSIYKGTVLYDRLIDGLWSSGSGAIYKRFITETDKYVVDTYDKNRLVDYAIGVDFGENTSATTFKLVGLARNYDEIVLLEEEHITEHKDTKLLQTQFLNFLRRCLANGWKIYNAYYDCAQKTLGESLKSAVEMAGLPCLVKACTKDLISERVNQEIVLMGCYRLKVLKHCKWGIKAFKEARYEDKSETRLDIVSPDNPIDDLDAFEYAYFKWKDNLMLKALYSRS